jgi:hypothetical protein
LSSIARFVAKSVDELKARPILPFGAPLKLGAVGVMEDDQFSPRGTVASLLHGRVGAVSTGNRANWQVTSGRDVSVNPVVEGEASGLFPMAPTASARVEVSFGTSESFFVSVSDLQVSTMTDPAVLLQKLLDAYQRGTWRKEYVLIYEIVVPRKALLLLSKEAKSNFLLSARGKATVPQGTGSVAGSFGLSYQSKDAIHLDSTSQALFFNAFRVQEGFLSGAVKVASFGIGPEGKRVFEPV